MGNRRMLHNIIFNKAIYCRNCNSELYWYGGNASEDILRCDKCRSYYSFNMQTKKLLEKDSVKWEKWATENDPDYRGVLTSDFYKP